jgi:hypothetical protein
MTVRSAAHARLPILLTAILALALGAGGVVAQTDVAPDQRDLPPVASPTNKVLVAPIPVVRSESEAAGDFGAGLMQGLIASGKIEGAVFVAVRDDHVVLAQVFGQGSSTAPIFDPAVLAQIPGAQGQLDRASTLDDASRFLLSFANGDLSGLTENVEPGLHPALPGHSSQFEEMRRNGWSARARDAQSETTQFRLVVVPEAKLAYFVSVAGELSASVWRATDNVLFDKMLPPREPADPSAASTAPPTARDAEQAAGVYEPELSRLSFLKTQGERLRVTGRADGALVLSGADTSILLPRPGGYWGAENGNQNAVLRDGELMLSSGNYRPLALWKRPGLYAALALLAAFSTAGAAVDARRKARPVPNELVLGAGGLTCALLVLAALVWFLSPAV